MTFQDFKTIVLEELIHQLSNYKKPFKIYIDALDIVIREILIQKSHPIAYESYKLNETKQQSLVYENEMTTIVHYLYSDTIFS